jgi:beta-galactosidase/beta-glucuronidase
LRAAGIIPDWNVGANSRECEWVEHRHWMYRARVPAEWLDTQARFRLQCQGLDYVGWVYVNGQEVGAFRGTHVPHEFDLTPCLNAAGNELEIIFDLAPRWLGSSVTPRR